jgi:SAM-dependent methyltransferase
MKTQTYTEQFHRELHSRSFQSARNVVPEILQLVRPHSVIDVGCGLGSWLAVFREHGIEEVLGVDGDYVDRRQLAIPEKLFRSQDLTLPLTIDQSFDLVMSLEVAEHLPPSAARSFVSTLTKLGPVILFSAAIPSQPGTHHVNLQWPMYWAKLFAEFGYQSIDCLRRRIWSEPDVDWWYAQNCIFYVTKDRLKDYPALASAAGTDVLPLVHPQHHEEQIKFHRRRADTAGVVVSLVPRDGTLILVDDGILGISTRADGRVLPFLERDGVYWGAPTDDTSAISELERMRMAGATRIVFLWSSFWWLSHYKKFAARLRSQHRLILEDDNAVGFDLN